MGTTLNIDDSLLHRAVKLTGVMKKTSLICLGLEALIARESVRRLAKLGDSEKHLLPFQAALRQPALTRRYVSIWLS